MASSRLQSSALVFSVQDIPVDGLDLNLSLTFDELYRGEEKKVLGQDDLTPSFSDPIVATGALYKVGSKVDLRGSFKTLYRHSCDRCNRPAEAVLTGTFDTFLMAKYQFSAHDKPGGKVIHGREGDKGLSRHHSRSKAAVLTDAEGEHEDESFGAYDGHTIDLRPIIRENLVLQIPMRVFCEESCEGLCLKCLERIEAHRCACLQGPTRVEPESSDKFSNAALTLLSSKD